MAQSHARRIRKMNEKFIEEQKKKKDKIRQDTLDKINKHPEPERSQLMMLFELMEQMKEDERLLKEEEDRLNKDKIF
jgi:hypothetical protein